MTAPCKSGAARLSKHLQKSRRVPVSRRERKLNPSFTGACASKMTLLMQVSGERPVCKTFLKKVSRLF